MPVEMRPRETVVEKVKCVRQQLECIRSQMTSPRGDAAVRCAELLGAAVEQMRRIDAAEVRAAKDPDVGAELRQIRSELKIVAALIDQAARFSQEMARVIGMHVNGYGRDGYTRGYAPGGSVRGVG